jgi:hypothetical protein
MSEASILSQSLRDFIYFPTTIWREFFRPTFYFGCNVNDVETEHEVLDDVGSYGKQINRILDAVMVLIKIDEDRMTGLTEDEKLAIWALKTLHKTADEASTRAEQRPRQA